MYIVLVYVRSHVHVPVSPRYGHMSEVWDLLRVALPEWKLPEQDWEKEATQETIKKDPTTPVVSSLEFTFFLLYPVWDHIEKILNP